AWGLVFQSKIQNQKSKIPSTREEGIEPATCRFGDGRSANLATPVHQARPAWAARVLLALDLMQQVLAVARAVLLKALLELLRHAALDVDRRAVVELVARAALQPHVFDCFGFLCHDSFFFC